MDGTGFRRSLYVGVDIRGYGAAPEQRQEKWQETLLRCLDRLRRRPRANIVKIFSAGETVTIAEILSAFARIAKRHPRIICSAGPARSLQPVRLQFQSTVWTDLPAPTRTDLAVGIQRVHQYLLSLFQQGRLPPPRPY